MQQGSLDFGESNLDSVPTILNPVQPIAGFFGPYRFLSNFWSVSVELDGLIYGSVENAYQAAKTAPENRRLFETCSAGEAKRLGREVPIRPEWADPQTKLAVMKDLVRQKFAFRTPLAKQLLETGNATLIEANTWGDTFWGQCKGRGTNHLGLILMDWRHELGLALSHQAQPDTRADEQHPPAHQIRWRSSRP